MQPYLRAIYNRRILIMYLEITTLEVVKRGEKEGEGKDGEVGAITDIREKFGCKCLTLW